MSSVQISIARRFRFEAAHQLPWHPGKCSALHGHSYVLEVEARGELDERGVVMDFAELDAQIDPIVAKLDHTFLNDAIDNPTAERVALWIVGQLEQGGLNWSRLRLWETEDGSVVLER